MARARLVLLEAQPRERNSGRPLRAQVPVPGPILLQPDSNALDMANMKLTDREVLALAATFPNVRNVIEAVDISHNFVRRRRASATLEGYQHGPCQF